VAGILACNFNKFFGIRAADGADEIFGELLALVDKNAVVTAELFHTLFRFFLELIGADTAQGALVIFGQLFALVDITADNTYILLHNFFSFKF
jgi:hypothetical protein